MSPSLEQRDTSFERLYRQHRRDVYGAVLRDVRDPDEAEDVTQIAFLNAFRAIRRGEAPEKPRAWLVTIARNVCKRRYRDLARRPQEVGLDPEAAAAVAEIDGPTAGEIAAAIRRLPENQRAVILLREVQGRSYAEIAAELELSVSAIETLLFRARGKLSEQLELSEHAPVTQKRRARGWLAFPLPGLGKLGSFGLSLGRVGAAAVVGGLAIVLPMSGPPPESSSQRAPSAAEAAGPVGQTAERPRPKAVGVVPSPRVRHRSGAATPAAPVAASGVGAGSLALPQVAVPPVSTLAPVSVPSLPVPPPLPPPPALPPPPPPLG